MIGNEEADKLPAEGTQKEAPGRDILIDLKIPGDTMATVRNLPVLDRHWQSASSGTGCWPTEFLDVRAMLHVSRRACENTTWKPPKATANWQPIAAILDGQWHRVAG